MRNVVGLEFNVMHTDGIVKVDINWWDRKRTEWLLKWMCFIFILFPFSQLVEHYSDCFTAQKKNEITRNANKNSKNGFWFDFAFLLENKSNKFLFGKQLPKLLQTFIHLNNRKLILYFGIFQTNIQPKCGAFNKFFFSWKIYYVQLASNSYTKRYKQKRNLINAI